MTGLNSVLDVSLSGAEAYQTAVNTVSQNISNVSTPGYALRSPLLVTAFEGAGQAAGTGVAVSGVERMSSQFANARLRSANADQGASNALVAALDDLQNNFPAQGGVSGALDQFLSDAKALATQPSDAPARQTLLADAGQLAGAFQQAAGNMLDAQIGLVSSGSQLATQINQILTQLETLNDELRSSATGSTNSLLDNQSALLQQLSNLIGFNAIRYGNGTVRLSVNGQVLLDQAGAQTVSLVTGPGGTPSLSVSGGQPLAASALSGQIGGTLAALNQSKALLQNLNRMAAVTASAVNTQQALGLTPAGTQGQPLFTQPAPTVLASPVNTGTETLNATLQNAAALPPDGGPFTLAYNGSQWQAVDQATGKAQSLGTGPNLSFSGIAVTVSGTPQAGDAFTVNPVAGAADGMSVTTTDPNALAAAAPYVATAGTVSASGTVTDTNTGTATVGAGTVVTDTTGSVVLPPSAFGQPLQLVFTSATAYQVETASGTVLATGTYATTVGGTLSIPYPAGTAASGSYWQMPIGGAPAAGDTFTLEAGGSQSGENADAMGQLGTTAGAVAGGLDGAWAQVTGAVGAAASLGQTAQINAATNASNAQAAQQSISGVSLDEQAGQLQLYAQAYQASAKAIATVGELFQALLSVV